ncbi:MAG TPA: hypothetical protein VMY41_03455 [Thermohalobaculum sp.]|nr:hypothetical protein [Thermohalobaculum sp.]
MGVKIPPMFKHRGFPEYAPGSDHKVTIRRAGKAPTPLKPRERYRDRKADMLRVDAFFLALLIDEYGDAPFPRGNLDAGRINWLLGREIVAAKANFDPESYETELRIDLDAVRASFPQVLDGGATK